MPGQPVVLDELGGLVAVARPEDLPEGASPRTNDTDFIVGRFIQRPGLQNTYSYEGANFGPNGGSSAVNSDTSGNSWANPDNILADDSAYATVDLATSSSASSSTSTGTSSGGGVAWTNPANIDDPSSFASVSLSAGGTNYTPSGSSGSLNVVGTFNNSPQDSSLTLSGFASVAATAATLYVDISGSCSATGTHEIDLYYSVDSGATWTLSRTWYTGFGATVIVIPVSGFTNLDTVQIQIYGMANWTSGLNAITNVNVTNWYATVAGAGQPSSQTLNAAIAGLSVPSNATITGFGLSFNADYSGVAPTFSVFLNVGTENDSITLTTTPAIYPAGGSSDLWGYGAWDNTTLAGLNVEFTASSTGTTTVNVNTLVVTVYYTLPNLISDVLIVAGFGFSLPSTSTVTGIGVSVKGFASSGTVYAQLVKAGAIVANTESIALPVSNGFVSLGGSLDVWGTTWAYSDVDDPDFGVALWAVGASAQTVSLDYCEIIVYGSASAANFNGLMSSNIDENDTITLATDANGLTWEENTLSAPNVLALASQIPAVPAGSYMKGLDVNGIAYLAFSDLEQGTSQPMQYNTQWCDRITQVGPGAAPTFTASESAGTQAAVTAYSYSAGILTLTTGTQAYTAGELVTFSGFTSGLVPLNGLTFSILGTGLTTTQIEIATSLVAGSGSDTGTATPQYTYPIVASPNGITQPPQASDPGSPGNLQGVLWSSGPGSTSAGNVITVYYSNQFHYANPDETLVNAFNAGYPVYVWIQGAPIGNGCWQVTSVGTNIPPGGEYSRWYFTFQVPTSQYQYYGLGHAPGTYEISQATVTTTTPVPGLAPGNQVSLAGVTGASWDGLYSIVEALNSGSFAITQTALTAGVATYTWALQSGVAPAAGELVTITNTLNANGLLNVTNAVIATATGVSSGTFTITGFPATTDYPTTVEAGQATTAGTQFIIDPGAALAGSVTQSPILGNSGGGTLTVVGAASGSTFPIGAGTRQGVFFGITRNGAVTKCSPPSTFTVATGANYITANVPVGPLNWVARGIAFTEAGQNGVPGANFYTYDTPVTFTVNGIVYTASALIIPDNTTTTIKVTFSDSVLLASDEIDIQGNNYFNLMELGNPAWMFQYADRMLYGLCQTKVQNFVNWSFDGGYWPTYSSKLPMPLGWSALGNGNLGSYAITAFQIASNVVTFTAANSLSPGLSVGVNGLSTGTYLNGLTFVVLTASGTQFTAAFSHANVGLTSDSGTAAVSTSSIGLVPSLDFGNAFAMRNLGATAWTNNAVLFQTAYQDAYNVAILQPNTPYSVRLKGRALGTAGQKVTVQLLTYANGVFGAVSYGSAEFTLALGNYQTQTATLVTGTGIPTIPGALVLALGVDTLVVGAGVEIDRLELFPTNHPVDTTTIWTSYAGKFESVDIVTGSLGVGLENAQSATGAFQLLEQLYVNKIKSRVVTQDSPNYEPNQWQVRQVSDRVGAVGPNASDEGEEFEISASRAGVYFFDGGKPMPIARELQSSGVSLNLWETINWNAGSTLWIRNDLVNRRLLIGVPMNLPNFWLPNASAATPTSPNIILMCNYTGCPTGEELAASSEVHITMFGDLKALDMRRKWSLWQIPCPVAEFISRPDGFTDQLFLANGIGSSKIYQLVNGAASGGQNTDDGAAINWLYTTYAFVKAKQGQQNPMLGALRKIWYYLAATMEGTGQVACRLLSNSLGAQQQNIFTIPLPFTLTYPQQNDQERVLEIGGQRVFIEFSSVGTGGYAECGPVMLDGELDKVSPHRGVSS